VRRAAEIARDQMTTALVCISLLGLLAFGLGFAVSTVRGRTETLTGSSGDPGDTLHKLVRAHGNTTEYAAMLAILMYAVGSTSPASWVLWCMGLATVSRYSIAIGLLLSPSMESPHPLRFVGALGTYITGFALCGALLLGI
jgi:uncharacterized membrane protein YecN with MAPEG domain